MIMFFTGLYTEVFIHKNSNATIYVVHYFEIPPSWNVIIYIKFIRLGKMLINSSTIAQPINILCQAFGFIAFVGFYSLAIIQKPFPRCPSVQVAKGLTIRLHAFNIDMILHLLKKIMFASNFHNIGTILMEISILVQNR